MQNDNKSLFDNQKRFKAQQATRALAAMGAGQAYFNLKTKPGSGQGLTRSLSANR